MKQHEIDLKGFEKSTKECYRLKFSNGYEDFTLDENWNLSCTGSFGNYAYTGWTPEKNRTFKRLLSQLDTGYYLLSKIGRDDYFDVDEFEEEFKINVIRLRKSKYWTKEEAREVYDWYTFNLEGVEEFDIVCFKIWQESPKCLDEPFEWMPEKTYRPNDRYFAKVVFGEFKKILEKELEEGKHE